MLGSELIGSNTFLSVFIHISVVYKSAFHKSLSRQWETRSRQIKNRSVIMPISIRRFSPNLAIALIDFWTNLACFDAHTRLLLIPKVDPLDKSERAFAFTVQIKISLVIA